MPKHAQDRTDKECCSDPVIRFQVRTMWKVGAAVIAVLGVALLTRLMGLMMGNG